jgi:hypothetical protein
MADAWRLPLTTRAGAFARFIRLSLVRATVPVVFNLASTLAHGTHEVNWGILDSCTAGVNCAAAVRVDFMNYMESVTFPVDSKYRASIFDFSQRMMSSRRVRVGRVRAAAAGPDSYRFRVAHVSGSAKSLVRSEPDDGSGTYPQAAGRPAHPRRG